MFWEELARKWDRYRPPMCPTEADAETYRQCIAGADRHVLMLGVTPQLAGLGQKLTALDGSKAMIDLVWPGDAPQRRAVLGNWLDAIPQDEAFTAAITDGGFIFLRWPDEYVLLFDRLRAACAPGFRFVSRGHFSENLQATPDLDALYAEVRAGQPVDPEIAKQRIGHAMAAEQGDPNISVRKMIAIAHDLLRDRPEERERMIQRPHMELDLTFSFPTRLQTIALLEQCGFRTDPDERERPGAFIRCTAP